MLRAYKTILIKSSAFVARDLLAKGSLFYFGSNLLCFTARAVKGILARNKEIRNRFSVKTSSQMLGDIGGAFLLIQPRLQIIISSLQLISTFIN